MGRGHTGAHPGGGIGHTGQWTEDTQEMDLWTLDKELHHSQSWNADTLAHWTHWTGDTQEMDIWTLDNQLHHNQSWDADTLAHTLAAALGIGHPGDGQMDN